ncbi:MAG: thioredoxin [Myxococcaceae bacterium]
MSANTKDLTKDTFEAAIKQDGIVMIDFWADWCMPCRMFAPTYEKAAEKYTDISFTKVNTQEQQELAGMFGIQSIPTLAVFRDGVLLYAEAGALPPQALEKLIETVKGLDMAEVKKQIAEAEAKAKAGGDGAKAPEAADEAVKAAEQKN